METLIHVLRGLLGIAAFVGIAWLLSENRKAINWRLVAAGVLLQISIAAIVIYFPPAREVVEWIGNRFVDLLAFTSRGVEFVFGSLADQSKHGVVFAISILPSIIFFAAFSSLLYYLGILQKVVYAFAWGVNRGVLDRATFEPVVRRGWAAMVRAVQADGMLGWVQRIGDKPGATSADTTEVYGVGALLLAGTEMHRLAGGVKK